MVDAPLKVARSLIEPRIYRAAFVPALLAAVIAMFSLESRPAAVPQALAADILFDGRVALADAKRLAATQPDRRPGTPGDSATATTVGNRLRAQHFAVTMDRFSAERELVNVVARRIGESPRQLVIVAARDARRVGDVAASAADTAALLEIARTLEGRATAKTLVLASVDGSTLGAAGARRLAGQLAEAGPVEAVIVLSNLGVPHANGSLLVPWSEGTTRGGVRLQRTLAESVRQEVERGGAGRSSGTPGQFARLVVPIGIGDQAPFVDAALDAVRLSGSGELPAEHAVEPSADRLGSLGRATLRAIFAYDGAAGSVGEKPSSFLTVAPKNLPQWSVAVLVLSLLLPVLAASTDSFARARRRREPVLPWLRWLLAGVVPFLIALAAAEFLVLVGQAPDVAPVPLPPRDHPLDGAGAVSLAVCLALFVAASALLRPWLARARRLPAPDRPGAGAALALLLCLTALAVWAANPFAALALLPAFHLWLLVVASPVAPSRPLGVGLVLAGLAIPALVVIGTLARLSLGPLGGAWYGFLLVTGHEIGLYTVVIASLIGACFAAALRIALARRPVADEAALRR
jgi:hypothetical protein